MEAGSGLGSGTAAAARVGGWGWKEGVLAVAERLHPEPQLPAPGGLGRPAAKAAGSEGQEEPGGQFRTISMNKEQTCLRSRVYGPFF